MARLRNARQGTKKLIEELDGVGQKSGMRLDSLEGDPEFLTRSRELENRDLGRGKKQHMSDIDLSYEVKDKVSWGRVEWFEKSVAKRACFFPESRMTLHVLDSCCQQACGNFLANSIPKTPHCNNCYHLLPQLKVKRPVCFT